MFVSSHLLSEVEHLADDVIVINDGRLITQGALAELQQAASLVRTVDPRRLAGVLEQAGAATHADGTDGDGSDGLVVRGMEIDEIGERAFKQWPRVARAGASCRVARRAFLELDHHTQRDRGGHRAVSMRRLTRSELHKLPSTKMPHAFVAVLVVIAALNASAVISGTDMDGSEAVDPAHAVHVGHDLAMRTHEVLWHCAALNSAEHSILTALDDGWQLSGVTVAPIGAMPGHIEYTVKTDVAWATQSASIALRGPNAAEYGIEHRGGSWRVNDEERPDLVGCVDIDLGWTPATNILPIRRLELAVGATATTRAAWFRFPEMSIEANGQQYTRVSDRIWRYVSGPFDFRLLVDEHGRVLEYGDDLWHAAAVSPDEERDR